MDFTYVNRPAFELIGIPLRTHYSRASAEIAAHWAKAGTDGSLFRLPGFSGDILALYTQYESDYTGAYTLVLGCIPPSGAAVPEGMQRYQVPAAHYATLRGEGPMPDKVVNAWRKVWETPLERTYLADFELYTGSPLAPDLQLFVGVR